MKTNYQGKKFDIGTVNQDLDLKSIEAQSPESIKDIESKKTILKQLSNTHGSSPQSPQKNLNLEDNTIPTDDVGEGAGYSLNNDQGILNLISNE